MHAGIPQFMNKDDIVLEVQGGKRGAKRIHEFSKLCEHGLKGGRNIT